MFSIPHTTETLTVLGLPVCYILFSIRSEWSDLTSFEHFNFIEIPYSIQWTWLVMFWHGDICHFLPRFLFVFWPTERNRDENQFSYRETERWHIFETGPVSESAAASSPVSITVILFLFLPPFFSRLQPNFWFVLRLKKREFLVADYFRFTKPESASRVTIRNSQLLNPLPNRQSSLKLQAATFFTWVEWWTLW